MIDLAPDIFDSIHIMAIQRSESIEAVISDLIRKGMMSEGKKIIQRNGFPLFPIRPNETPVTSELIKSLEDEL
ncbi:MAG: hypothetical protein KIH69_001420 [Anaerolineae bacterium]|nr:hypothetical protein [Anaerolineae bacterium]